MTATDPGFPRKATISGKVRAGLELGATLRAGSSEWAGMTSSIGNKMDRNRIMVTGYMPPLADSRWTALC